MSRNYRTKAPGTNSPNKYPSSRQACGNIMARIHQYQRACSGEHEDGNVTPLSSASKNQQRCVCGATFAPSANFCTNCGQQKQKIGQAPSISVSSVSAKASAQQTLPSKQSTLPPSSTAPPSAGRTGGFIRRSRANEQQGNPLTSSKETTSLLQASKAQALTCSVLVSL